MTIMTRHKRALCILTAAAIASSVMMLSGCNQKNNSSSGETGNVSLGDEKVKTALSYKTEDIKPPKTVDSTVVYSNGKLYGVHSLTKTIGDKTETSVSIIIFDEQGQLIKEIPVGSSSDANEYVFISGELQVNESGITFLFEKMSNTGTTVNELRTIDEDGNVLSTADLSSALPPDGYIGSWIKDKDGELFINTGSEIIALDKDGNKQYSITPDGNSYITGVFLTNEGLPAYNYINIGSGEYTGVINVIDKAAKAPGKKINIAGGKSWAMQSGSGDYI
ncbi:MAG: hypothetical protein ILP19_04960, partial [Oscillospiraceae bacterium]|nr:hypothetical protein [Oscillospiraceae bacterium]